ncbi:hypothetical protein [Roseiconus nitratireducens]|uniref:hypothetical protein n=1 Tax=Roseiconus nitratireducens TaxID=2605748 RepID=UPI001F43E62D|nr:hypothetical protein [Roseiconus nitratireducens]
MKPIKNETANNMASGSSVLNTKGIVSGTFSVLANEKIASTRTPPIIKNHRIRDSIQSVL